MTSTLERDEPRLLATNNAPLPVWAPWALAAVAAAVAGGLLAVTSSFSLVWLALLGLLLFAVALNLVSRRFEGRRRATDRLVTTIVTSAFVLALLPLISLLYTVISEGSHRFDVDFFTQTMDGVVGRNKPGGAKHAIIGTGIITLLATLISVPIGLLSAIYLVEYGKGRLAKSVTFLVDVMTGIPSIVAGLFAYALFELLLGAGIRIGIGGAVALAVLMIPVVVRSSEEMLKLVPAELREASYALGVPRWKTIVKVVLPVAAAGIGTGITIAIARVIGETAPLLLIVGTTVAVNANPFNGRMETLPVYIYYQFTQPGVPRDVAIERAWTAALILILIVLVLNVIARLIAKAFAPKGSR